MSELVIRRSVDIEDEIRRALMPYMTAYVKPLPANFTVPSIEITQVGGTDQSGHIDTFEVTLDSRAKVAGDANEQLRNAIGILRSAAGTHQTAIRAVMVNTFGGWGADPLRPDLAMYTARISVVAHLEQTII